MNHPPADVHKRFSVPIYKMMYIPLYTVRGNTAVYIYATAGADAHFQNTEC